MTPMTTNNTAKRGGPKGRHYADEKAYEKKMKLVLERLGAELVDYEWMRFQAFIQFRYKGKMYDLRQSAEQSKGSRVEVSYGTDCFCQIVRILEALEFASDTKVFDFGQLMDTLPQLTAPLEACFVALGFTSRPASVEEIEAAYRKTVKTAHPDTGGNAALFQLVQKAREDAIKLVSGVGK